MGSHVKRRTLIRLAAAGLSSALVPLMGCAKQVGVNYGTTHFPTPDEPLTPVDQFYFQSIVGAFKVNDLKRYRLNIGGVAERALTLSIDDLQNDFEVVDETITLACVGNNPGGSLLSSCIFRGVRVRDVMERAGVSSDASGAMIFGLEGFAAYQNIDDLRRRESIFAFAMGPSLDRMEALPIENGFPCRILTPGLYGYMQPKWIDSVNFVDHGGYQGVITRSIPYFDGSIQLASGFSYPRGGRFPIGNLEMLGYAYGDGRPITAVQVSVDGGPWNDAEIVWNSQDDELPDYLWVLWHWNWNASPGEHTLRVRAFYEDGTTQFDGQRFPYSGGSIADMKLRIGDDEAAT